MAYVNIMLFNIKVIYLCYYTRMLSFRLSFSMRIFILVIIYDDILYPINIVDGYNVCKPYYVINTLLNMKVAVF